MSQDFQKVALSAVTMGLLVVAQALRKELTAANGDASWETGFRNRIKNDLKSMNFEGISIDREPTLYEAAFAAIDLVFASDEDDPGAGTEGH